MRSVLLLACVLVAPSVQAEEVYYPGSSWTSSGRMLTPAEPRNWLTVVHAEQGIAYRGLELYGMTEFWKDKHKFDWNNRNIGGVGLRFTQSVRTGMVRAGVSYLADHRRLPGLWRYQNTYTHGLTFSVESYFGWGHRQREFPHVNPVFVGTPVPSEGGR